MALSAAKKRQEKKFNHIWVQLTKESSFLLNFVNLVEEGDAVGYWASKT